MRLKNLLTFSSSSLSSFQASCAFSNLFTREKDVPKTVNFFKDEKIRVRGRKKNLNQDDRESFFFGS